MMNGAVHVTNNWGSGEIPPPSYDENDPEFADLDDLYQKLNTTELQKSLSRDLHQWGAWRTDCNNALIEKTAKPPPSLNSYLEAKSAFDPPPDFRVASLQSLMEFSVSDKNTSSIPPDSYRQFGIPRARKDLNSNSSQNSRKDVLQNNHDRGGHRIAASMGNLHMHDRPPPYSAREMGSYTGINEGNEDREAINWPNYFPEKDKRRPQKRDSLDERPPRQSFDIERNTRQRYSLQGLEWDRPRDLDRHRRGSENWHAGRLAQAGSASRTKPRFDFQNSTPDLHRDIPARRRSSTERKHHKVPGGFPPPKSPPGTQPATSKNKWVEEFKDFISPLTGQPPKSPTEVAKPQKVKPKTQEKEDIFKVAKNWGGISQSAYDLVSSSGPDW